MKTFLVRGFAALVVGVLGVGLFTSTASANGKDGGKPSGAAAVVKQLAGNSNSTYQSSSASIANVQENWVKPFSRFTFDWSKFGKPDQGKPDHGKPDDGKPCGCDGKPDHGKPDHGPSAPAGDVTQDNGATNEATSGTANVTDQGIAQTGSATATSEGSGVQGKPYDGKPGDGKPEHGEPCGCDGKPDHGKPDHDPGDAVAIVDQEAGNNNSTGQESTATVDNDQTNVYRPVDYKSPGAGSGDVSQSNDATNTASSGTVNETAQGIVQDATAEATTESDGGYGPGAYGSGGSGDATAVVDQTAGNSNETDQTSTATVENDQTNVYIPINLGSPGAGSGDVNQSNEATNTAESATVNLTDQGIAQGADATAESTGGGDAVAIVDQGAGNDNSTVQDSAATVTNNQLNIAIPINVLSPGAGSGDINQSNEASNSASSMVGNSTTQGIAQLGTAVASVTG